MSEEIKTLRLEARRLNAKVKAKVRATGQAWVEMDAEDMADFDRYNEIRIQISRLQQATNAH